MEHPWAVPSHQCRICHLHCSMIWLQVDRPGHRSCCHCPAGQHLKLVWERGKKWLGKFTNCWGPGVTQSVLHLASDTSNWSYVTSVEHEIIILSSLWLLQESVNTVSSVQCGIMKEQVGGADVLEREWVWERRGALKTHRDYAFGLALIILCLLTVLEKKKQPRDKI